MKVKLAKVYYEYEQCCDDYTKRMFISTISDWEELTNKQNTALHKFVQKYNTRTTHEAGHYIVLEEVPNAMIFECIEKQMAKEKIELERIAKREKERELDKKKKEMDRKLRKEIREQAMFEKLSKKYAAQS